MVQEPFPVQIYYYATVPLYPHSENSLHVTVVDCTELRHTDARLKEVTEYNNLTEATEMASKETSGGGEVNFFTRQIKANWHTQNSIFQI